MLVADAVEAFVAEMETMGLAASTVHGQAGYLRRLARTCGPIDVREISSTVLARYFATAQNHVQGTRNNLLVPVRGFLKWCEMQEYLFPGSADRLLAGRRARKAVRRPKHYVPAGQFGRMLDASGQRHPADRAVMALALYTLGRRGEIAGLRLKDVSLRDGTIQMYRQKRRHWTAVAICPELEAELLAWLHWYAQATDCLSAAVMMDRHPDWMLVPRLEPIPERSGETGQFTGSVTGYALEPGSQQQHMERIVKRALGDLGGVKTPDGKTVRFLGEGMHTVRRSGARAMLDHLSGSLGQDRAVLQVATMLDHEDPKVTLLYIGMNQERDALNEFLRSNSPYGTSAPVRHLRQVS